MILVSVIIPIYNVERFIVKCAESLMQQTLKNNIEYIFVDDCSPDNSILLLNKVLKRYPERKAKIKIVRHKKNKGLPSARNTGMQYASGKYIYHCDSDDYLECNTLELMVERAEKDHSDIVWSDWYLTFNRKERYMKQPSYSTSEEALKGLLQGYMKYNVWNKLVLHSLYINNNIKFPDGHSMGEDMTMIKLFACSTKISYVPFALYHYVKTNDGAFTNHLSDKALKDIQWNATNVIDFLLQNKGKCIIEDLYFFKLNIKYPFLISDKDYMYKLWQSWYPEANPYIFKYKGTLRSRILQYSAYKGYFGFIKMHYYLLYKLIYGILYR